VDPGTIPPIAHLAADGNGQSMQVVHQRLRFAILRGDLPPEAVYSQVQLAEQLGVSRTPLREALRMLQLEQLVELAPNRRVRIAAIRPDDVEQIYVMRLTLESMALRLSVPRLTPEEIGQLEGAFAEMSHFASAHDYERWEVPHRAFHLGLVANSGRRTVAVLEQLYDHADRCRRLAMRTARDWNQGAAEHRAILEAAKARDLDACVVALVTHQSCTAFRVLELIDPGQDAPLLRDTAENLTGGAAPCG
jgi:GntR family transcriptional regulator, rspAB operon transcriptional repressor